MWEALAGILGKALDAVPVARWMRENSRDRIDHDRKRFRELDELLPERALDRYLEEAFQQQVLRSTVEPVDEYLEWARFSSNDFVIARLQQRRAAFDHALVELRGFLSRNLFPRKGVSDRWYFRPAQNPDLSSSFSPEDLKRYDRAVEGLNEHISNCETSYKSFRQVVKKRLMT